MRIMNSRINERAKKFLLSLLWLLFIPATYILTLIASANPASVERIYSNGMYEYIANAIPFQYFPYTSIAEIIFLVAPIVLIVCLIAFIVRLVRNSKDRLWRVLDVIKRALIVFGVAYFLFYLCWGFNYFRLSYSEIADLPLRNSSTRELKELCFSLIDRTNEARNLLPTADDGTLDLNLSTADLQDITRAAYKKACEDSIHGISANLTYPKALKISPLLSYTGISGVYVPYTAEANFNNDSPMPLIGATICHELAHRQGFAREDEANFIAYLVCSNSDDNYLNYSGLLLASIHSMNKLGERDPQIYAELHKLYSDEVVADIYADRAFWNARSGPLEELVTNINDNYLKGNNLDDGVASYGRMVDLLLALQRVEN